MKETQSRFLIRVIPQNVIIGVIVLLTDFFAVAVGVQSIHAHRVLKCHPSPGLVLARTLQMGWIISFLIMIAVGRLVADPVTVTGMKVILRYTGLRRPIVSYGVWVRQVPHIIAL